ncbi:MAG: hypothetical protein ACRC9H_17435 [Aeromonas veronii]
MDGSIVKDPGTAGGAEMVIDQDAMDNGLRKLNGLNNELDGQKSGEKKVEYLKELTLVMNIMENKGIKVEDIIRAVTKKIGNGKLLALRPKNTLEYELTLTCADDCEDLINGVEIKRQLCGVRRLELKECVVSFLHLPAYVEDGKIKDKLKLWGVIPITKIKRRLYPGTDIADGTRYVKIRFSKDVTSLPYSAKFETADGERYFRVIHDGQIQLCRMCMQPGHIFKDCPDFKCFDCAEQGHFARDCKADKCLDCNKVFMKCVCETESEVDKSNEETEIENVESSLSESEQNTQKERNGVNLKDFNKEAEKKNEMVTETKDSVGKIEKTDENKIIDKEVSVSSIFCTDLLSKETEGNLLCNVNIDEMEKEVEGNKRDRANKDEKNKTETQKVKNQQRKEFRGACAAKYGEIPNLNVVLRKQKIRRIALKKKRERSTYGELYERAVQME